MLSATYQLEAIEGSRPASEVSAQAESAARKALDLEDSLPDAHNSMCAWYHFFAWDLPRADAECRRAIELSPSCGELRYLRHWVLMAMNRQDEAAQEIKRAIELDPFARAWGPRQFSISGSGSSTPPLTNCKCSLATAQAIGACTGTCRWPIG